MTDNERVEKARQHLAAGGPLIMADEARLILKRLDMTTESFDQLCVTHKLTLVELETVKRERDDYANQAIGERAGVIEQTARAEKAERWLGNLLAIIHRDGGHHQAEVGDEQAVKDAHERWGRLIGLAEQPLRVVAVAIKTFKDGVIHVLPRPNRHHTVIHALHYAGIELDGREGEGFLLSDGSFADRPWALVVARAAGQVLRETGSHIGLFSEDVW